MIKRNKINLLLSSIAATVIAASILAGGTYALFSSESKVNIAITSGKVEVVASVVDDSLKSSHQEYDSESGAYGDIVEGTLSNNGCATYNDTTQEVEILGMAKSDKVTFNIKITNQSNVEIKYRTVIAAKGDSDLISKLNISAESTELVSTAADPNKFVNKWQKFTSGDPIELPIVIEYPVDESTTTSSTETTPSCSIKCAIEAVPANMSTTDPEETTTSLSGDDSTGENSSGGEENTDTGDTSSDDGDTTTDETNSGDTTSGDSSDSETNTDSSDSNDESGESDGSTSSDEVTP